jgi:uncharacterized cupredoxin-like copper-binding protein
VPERLTVVRANVRSRALVGVVVLATTTLLAACGGDDDDSTAASSTTVAPPTESEPDQVLEFSGHEYAFEGPKQASAGFTRITLDNTGQEDHQLALFRMNEGVEAGTVLGKLQTEGLDSARDLGEFVAGPNGTAPGTATDVVVDLQPGTYIVACVIPDQKGVPHAAQGMLTELTVTAASEAPSEDPEGLPVLGLGDYSFELPDDFDGRGPLVIENRGAFAHEAVVARLDGITVDDVIAYETQPFPRAEAPPYKLADGITPIDPGGKARVDLDLEPGDYAWVCFLPGPEGEPHLAIGMEEAFTVR